jgi:hypothetical protein
VYQNIYGLCHHAELLRRVSHVKRLFCGQAKARESGARQYSHTEPSEWGGCGVRKDGGDEETEAHLVGGVVHYVTGRTLGSRG